MRIVDHVEDEISSLELDERTAFIEQRGDSGSFVGWLADTERPERYTTSPRSQSVSDAPRHPVAVALSWLAVCLIEGFAAYGHTFYPGFVDPREIDDHQQPAAGSQSRSQAQGEHESAAPWLTASYPRATPAGWIKSASSAVAKVWSSLRFKWQARRTITELGKLDDRALKDIGLHRCQIASAARHLDQYDWWHHHR